MDYIDLKRLVRQGENSKLEFKLKANHPEKSVREAVAFANSEGGTLLIGVNDDKIIKGLKFAGEDEYVLTRALQNHCSPQIKYELKKVSVESEREVLVFHIPKSDRVHYFVPVEKQRKGRAYIRIEDKSVQASSEMYQIMLAKTRKKDVKFRYGDKERMLMQYLQIHNQITVEEFSKTAKIPRWLASRTLVLMVLARVLQIIPNEVEDTFEFLEYEDEVVN